MPSTTSSSVSSDFASSTVMTPSLPTLFIASARNRPISASPFDEIVPTWAISSLDVTLRACWRRSPTIASTARSTPRLRSIGFMPAATDLAPSRTMACASTVAVVVPSPARSLVFEATSRTIWAPMFSNLSASSISLATVTPSLVMRGAPKDLSMTTLRPLGPSVTLTASARMSTPRSIFSRASPANFTSLAAICLTLRMLGLNVGERALGDDAHDVGFLHDQEVLTVEAHLGAGPLAEQHAVSGLDVEGDDLAALVPGARADGDDLALLRLFLRGIGDDDAALRLLLGLDTADDDAVVQRTELHAKASLFLVSRGPSRPPVLAC